MDLSFNIDYRTRFGEDLVLNIVSGDGVERYHLVTADGNRWTCGISKPRGEKTLDYYFTIERDGKTVRHEWRAITHRLEIGDGGARRVTLYGRWMDTPEDAHLYSSAFTDCIHGRRLHRLPRAACPRTVRLIVRAPQLRAGERLGLIGAQEALGAWESTRAVNMVEQDYNEWAVDLNAADFPEGRMEFKFAALDARKDVTPLWETGNNRTIQLPPMADGDMVAYELDGACMPIYNARLAGTLVPVFSLRSRDSFGVGDFGDLKKMVDFVSQTGQRVLQILPVNDTTATHTWTDSYPYSCISIFALHPQYADLTRLPALKDRGQREKFEALRRELNALPQVDYERANGAKLAYLRLLYAQEGEATMGTPDFRRFFREAGQWLVPYAQYCTLRDNYGTADFSRWPDHKRWAEADRKALAHRGGKEFRDVAFWYCVQYWLDRQLAAVHDYARQRHVILKGDIPIGVSRYGCDVWAEPRYFHLDGQAGAPPDAFSANGQNWGFPTYDWEEMLKDGCRWWVRRLRHMARFFDAYRIDHVLGFFRIWEIPISSVHGLLGQFSPALGLTRGEVEAYGLEFRERLFCDPFITGWALDRVFGKRAGEVKAKYLDPDHGDFWRLKPQFDTQRKIEKAFAGVTDKDELNLRDGLYSLVSDVLFVRDRKAHGKFHPRISAQFDFAYKALGEAEKAAFNRLYNDYFYRRNNQFWYQEAMKKLPILVQATRMLACAEDLGMVPDCVAWVMDELKILSLEIQSMPKDPHVRFGHLSRNPYRSVCTFSTHDMPTLRQWWDEDYARTQDYYNTMLYRQGPAPHPLPGWLSRDILSRQLTSPSMLCILSIQDWMSMDENLRREDADAERVNVPANPHHYWRYRMHVCLEDLMADKSFCQNVRDLIYESGR